VPAPLRRSAYSRSSQARSSSFGFLGRAIGGTQDDVAVGHQGSAPVEHRYRRGDDRASCGLLVLHWTGADRADVPHRRRPFRRRDPGSKPPARVCFASGSKRGRAGVSCTSERSVQLIACYTSKPRRGLQMIWRTSCAIRCWRLTVPVGGRMLGLAAQGMARSFVSCAAS
jgi:hypothetical protein